jgi:murein DD-endopeptidase MepM/ murein hydrolase activator NlpD
MALLYYPIEVMQLRDQQLQSNYAATFGKVRNNQTTPHQGWDLYAPVGTRCYAIAAGYVDWIKNEGNYGVQLALSFNRDGSSGASIDPLIAFYAHLLPGSIQIQPGSFVQAGQYVAQTGASGNANPSAPHLHFEIRTTSAKNAGLGLGNRIDPGGILGYRLYNSQRVQIGGQDAQRYMSVVRGMPTPVVR